MTPTDAGAGGGAGLPGSQGRSASLAAAAASPAGRGRGPLLASITPGVAAGGEEMFEEAEEEVLAGSQGLLGVELVWTGGGGEWRRGWLVHACKTMMITGTLREHTYTYDQLFAPNSHCSSSARGQQEIKSLVVPQHVSSMSHELLPLYL
jgi:hypothetical protein